MNYAPYGFYSDEELADLPTLGQPVRSPQPALPALETQQAVRDFQVRSPQSSMRDRLAMYPGAGGDPDLGRNRLASHMNTRDLAGGNEVFPSLMRDGPPDQGPARTLPVTALHRRRHFLQNH